MEILNLPQIKIRTLSENGSQRIYDEFRRKFDPLTPEEWVRQHFVHYLVRHLSYPASLLAIEKEIAVGSLRRRPDLVVYDRNGSPVLIAEFKAPNVRLDEETLFQAALYNKKLRVPYIVLSNGKEHYCAKLEAALPKLTYLKSIPVFDSL